MLKPVLIGFFLGFVLVGASRIASATDDSHQLMTVEANARRSPAAFHIVEVRNLPMRVFSSFC